MKHIVVVYSHTGKAYALAETYAKKHNADLFRIEPKFEPQGFFAYVWFGYKATLKRPIKLKEDHVNLKHYEQMTLFCPIHAETLCAPVLSYLKSHKTYLPKTDLVLTHMAKDRDYRAAAHRCEDKLEIKFKTIESLTVK